LFAYLIKEDAQNVLLLLARKPRGTSMILWSRPRGFDSWSFTFGLRWSWSKNHRHHRDVLLAQYLLPVISSNVCWMCGRNEV